MRTSHGYHPSRSWRSLHSLPGLAVLLCLLLLALPMRASADGGGFPTPTPTSTFTPIPSLTPTMTPVPTLAPTSALLAPATATPLVLETTADAAARQPISGFTIGGLLCWPFAVGLIVIVVLVASVFLRPTPP